MNQQSMIADTILTVYLDLTFFVVKHRGKFTALAIVKLLSNTWSENDGDEDSYALDMIAHLICEA